MILPETVVQDLRYGCRMVFRNPGFTTVAVLALAVGIGVNTAGVTAYKAMIARPIEARDPSRIVVMALVRRSGAADFDFSYPDYAAYRDSVHSLHGLIAFRQEQLTLANPDGSVSRRSSAGDSLLGRLGMLPPRSSNAESASVFAVSENYFKVLGVAPLSGRTFESITVPELVASPSALISENYWRKRFASDPGVLGKTVRLNAATVQIIGITPHDFLGTGVSVPDFWLPLTLEPLVHADGNWLRDRENECCRLFARLAAGASIRQAQAEMTLVANRLRSLHDPHSDSAQPVTAIVWPGSPFPLPLKFYHGLETTILLIMLASAMLLVVACANVGSLQLARARSRQHELHTRLSLGASRLRVIRQLLTESALLGFLAGVIALLVGWAVLQVGVTLLAEAVPADYGTLIFHVAPDFAISAYGLAISLAAGMLFGLAPAIESSRGALSSGVRGGTAPTSTRRLQDLLVAAQVSLSLVLMIAGSMLIHSSIRSLNMRTGYDGKHVVDIEIQFPEGPKYTAARKLTLMRELHTQLAALSGVAAVTSARPPAEMSFRTAALPVDEKGSKRNRQSVLCYTYVQPNYFETVGVQLFLGRGFPSQGETEHSVVVSESAAKQLWGNENPVGRSFRLGPLDERFHNRSDLSPDGPAYQVVGVVRDTRGVEFDGSDTRQVYVPLPDDRLQGEPILIRTRSGPAQVIKAMDPVISSLDPNLMANYFTVEQLLRRSTVFITSSLAAAIASSVGLAGLLLALLGIYGTVSYIVLLRTREVGIRMAVGAQKHDILWLILGESTRPVIAGLFAGMFLALGASYLLRGVLYGISSVDSLSFIGVSLLFLTIALFAAYPPSRRAMRVDPMVALRYE